MQATCAESEFLRHWFPHRGVWRGALVSMCPLELWPVRHVLYSVCVSVWGEGVVCVRFLYIFK